MTNFLSNKFFYKTIYTGFYLGYMLNEKFSKPKMKCREGSFVADRFLEFNNKRIKKICLKKQPKNIALLLPHCLQSYECPYKITSHIENCKKCGRCKIGKILELKEEYNIEVKVATGGTLARLFIKETKPHLIIAVACKRDLISGIYDSFPMNVYGIYNKIKNSPCINTDLDIDYLGEVIRWFRG